MFHCYKYCYTRSPKNRLILLDDSDETNNLLADDD